MKLLTLWTVMLAGVLLVSVPAMAQLSVPVLSPGTNVNGTAEDVCATGNQDLGVDVPIQVAAPVTAPVTTALGDATSTTNPAVTQTAAEYSEESADINDSCNDTSLSNDEDTNPSQELEQQADSGDLDNSSDSSVTGDGNVVCSPVQQDGDTGNSVNGQAIQGADTQSEDTELGGIGTEDAPEAPTDCAPTNQESLASS
jgi:hypothetical protein